MRKSIAVAFAGIMSALSVMFLYLGSIVWIFAYITPLICGLIMMIVMESGNFKTALSVYFTVGIISVILLEDKESSLLYILFFGYYPMIKGKLDTMNKFLSFVLKLLVFNAAVVAGELILYYVFGIPFDDSLGKWGIVIMLILANFVFIIYEKVFHKFIILYRKKFKNKVDKYLK